MINEALTIFISRTRTPESARHLTRFAILVAPVGTATGSGGEVLVQNFYLLCVPFQFPLQSFSFSVSCIE